MNRHHNILPFLDFIENVHQPANMPQNTAQRAFWAKKRKSGTKNASKGKRQKSAKEKLAEVERDDPIEDASETDEGSPAAKRARWGTPEPSIADLESSIEDKSEKVSCQRCIHAFKRGLNRGSRSACLPGVNSMFSLATSLE